MDVHYKNLLLHHQQLAVSLFDDALTYLKTFKNNDVVTSDDFIDKFSTGYRTSVYIMSMLQDFGYLKSVNENRSTGQTTALIKKIP